MLWASGFLEPAPALDIQVKFVNPETKKKTPGPRVHVPVRAARKKG
jgi:hypothetical protein